VLWNQGPEHIDDARDARQRVLPLRPIMSAAANESCGSGPPYHVEHVLQSSDVMQ
jgi:hypothetical protein